MRCRRSARRVELPANDGFPRSGTRSQEVVHNAPPLLEKARQGPFCWSNRPVKGRNTSRRYEDGVVCGSSSNLGGTVAETRETGRRPGYCFASLGSSILINGKNLFYTTTLTPGLCQPTGFTVSYLQAPTIRSLTDPACAGTQIGYQLDGCPLVGGSVLTITGTGFLPSTTVTTSLCSNVIWIDQNTLQCRLSSGITPGRPSVSWSTRRRGRARPAVSASRSETNRSVHRADAATQSPRLRRRVRAL